MKYDDIVVGMKVIPYSKTIFGKLNDSSEWRKAKEINQPYLYVTGKPGSILLNHRKNDINSGDYFNPQDFELYIEEDVRMKLWEILRNWENGWRGIAIDRIGNEHNFTHNTFSNKYQNNVVAIIGEEWKIKEEKSQQKIQLENLIEKLNGQLNEAQAELEKIKNK